MILKAVLILCAVLALALGAAALVAHSRGQDIDTLTAEKRLAENKLTTTQADLRISAENSAKMLGEKDRLIDSMMQQKDDEREAEVAAARIKKDIEHATDSKACVSSPPVHVMLSGLQDLERRSTAAAGADHQLPAAGSAGTAAGVSPAAGGAGSADGK